MPTISLAIQKGGSGKTTTALNLAAALRRLGRSVLLVDLDPQANLTHSLGIRDEDGERENIYHLLRMEMNGKKRSSAGSSLLRPADRHWYPPDWNSPMPNWNWSRPTEGTPRQAIAGAPDRRVRLRAHRLPARHRDADGECPGSQRLRDPAPAGGVPAPQGIGELLPPPPAAAAGAQSRPAGAGARPVPLRPAQEPARPLAAGTGGRPTPAGSFPRPSAPTSHWPRPRRQASISTPTPPTPTGRRITSPWPTTSSEGQREALRKRDPSRVTSPGLT